MIHDLTTSEISRQNVLNNRYALSKLEEHLALGGLQFEGELIFTKVQEMVSERTIDRYLTAHSKEINNLYVNR